MARRKQTALANVRFLEGVADRSTEESGGGYVVPLVSAALRVNNDHDSDEGPGESQMPGQTENKRSLLDREEQVQEHSAGLNLAGNYQIQSAQADYDSAATTKRTKTSHDNMGDINPTDHGSSAHTEAGENPFGDAKTATDSHSSNQLTDPVLNGTSPGDKAQSINTPFDGFISNPPNVNSFSANSEFLYNVRRHKTIHNLAASNSQYLQSKRDASGDLDNSHANSQDLQSTYPPPNAMVYNSNLANSQYLQFKQDTSKEQLGISHRNDPPPAYAQYLLGTWAKSSPERTGPPERLPPPPFLICNQPSSSNSQFLRHDIGRQLPSQQQQPSRMQQQLQQRSANTEFLGRLSKTQNTPPEAVITRQYWAPNTGFLGQISKYPDKSTDDQINAANTESLSGLSTLQEPNPQLPEQHHQGPEEEWCQRQPTYSYDTFKQSTTQNQLFLLQRPSSSVDHGTLLDEDLSDFDFSLDNPPCDNVSVINGLHSRRDIEAGLHLRTSRENRSSSDATTTNDSYPGHPNASQASFPYETLPLDSSNSIRLLSFEMASSADLDADELHCTVTVRNPWKEPITYHCLSYCWGGEQKTHNILIKTSQPGSNYSISITRNLHRALKQVIQSQGVQQLWVDALCINQNDAIERSAQVAMMKQIYSKAAGVVIWLGEGETTAFAQTCTKAIDDVCQRFTEATGVPSSSVTGPQGLTLNLAQLDELKKDADSDPDAYYCYTQISRFFSLPWFRRVWVLQEAFSNTSVEAWLGSHHLHWGQIILAALWHSFLIRDYISKADEEPPSDTQADTGYLPELWLGLVHNRVPRGLSMIELVCRARDFQATDPRDKVFALLGLANDSPNVCPDYTKSKTQVYTDFAKSIISQTGNLDVLSAVDTFTFRREPRSDPSWMPDLDVSVATIRGLGFPRKYNAAFSTPAIVHPAATDSSSYFNREDLSRILSLTGFEIDALTSTISPLLSLTKDLTLYIGNSPTTITTLWHSYIRCQPQFEAQDAGATYKAFVRTLTATGFALPTSFPAHPLGTVVPPEQALSLGSDFLAYYTRADPSLSVLKDVPGFGDEELVKTLAERGDAEQFAVLAGKACDERLFFVSEAGKMGLCPREAKAEDRVVVLYGGSVPYVLRPLDDGLWKFVGECYVDGIMFGEAGALRDQEGIANRVFNIC